MGKGLHVDLNFDVFGFSVDVPLQAIEEWLDDVSRCNAVSRSRETGEKPVLRLRVACPHCGAGHHVLARIETSEGDVGACKKCGGHFLLGG